MIFEKYQLLQQEILNAAITKKNQLNDYSITNFELRIYNQNNLQSVIRNHLIY